MGHKHQNRVREGPYLQLYLYRKGRFSSLTFYYGFLWLPVPLASHGQILGMKKALRFLVRA
jgi:hypothetical protein